VITPLIIIPNFVSLRFKQRLRSLCVVCGFACDVAGKGGGWELELVQSHMAQKPVLRDWVKWGARVLRVRSVSREEKCQFSGIKRWSVSDQLPNGARPNPLPGRLGVTSPPPGQPRHPAPRAPL